MRLLGVEDDRVPLDEVVGKLTGLSIKADMSVEEKDDVIVRLRRQVEELDSELQTLEAELNECQQELAVKEREMADLKHNIHIA